MGLPVPAILRALGNSAAKTGGTVARLGSGFYNRVAAPVTKKSLGLVTGAADVAADQLMKNPLRTLYIGGSLAAVGAAVPRHWRNRSAIRNSVQYRYF